MLTSNKALEVFAELAKKATVNRIIACPDETRLRIALQKNEPIPDHCLPGRLVLALPEEERKALSSLKASDIECRPDAFWF